MLVPCLRCVRHWSTGPVFAPSAYADVRSPGATMSGLVRRSVVGPNDEYDAMSSNEGQSQTLCGANVTYVVVGVSCSLYCRSCCAIDSGMEPTGMSSGAPSRGSFT